LRTTCRSKVVIPSWVVKIHFASYHIRLRHLIMSPTRHRVIIWCVNHNHQVFLVNLKRETSVTCQWLKLTMFNGQSLVPLHIKVLMYLQWVFMQQDSTYLGWSHFLQIYEFKSLFRWQVRVDFVHTRMSVSVLYRWFIPRDSCSPW
jgi:hypothetical protein